MSQKWERQEIVLSGRIRFLAFFLQWRSEETVSFDDPWPMASELEIIVTYGPTSVLFSYRYGMFDAQCKRSWKASQQHGMIWTAHLYVKKAQRYYCCELNKWKDGWNLNHVYSSIAIHKLVVYCHGFQESFSFLLWEWLRYALVDALMQCLNFALILKEVIIAT